MPYPENKAYAKNIENVVREGGAVPATIAIFNGLIHVGLKDDQISKLAEAGTTAKKVSRRDLPFILSSCGIGATTVSGTMIASHQAGIDIFVTGGIGGVHRGYEQSMDASADLRELGRTPITVVSAGVKSVLDIAKTLEYLETEGVPVVTYRSKYFPAFFSASSGIESPVTLDSTLEIAKMIYCNKKLHLNNGMLIAVPNCRPIEGEFI